MASTETNSSGGARELKKLQGEIKTMNRRYRLKVTKSYIWKDHYHSDGRTGLEHKIKALIDERDHLKEKKLKFKKREWKLQDQKQDLKAKILDLKTAYHALKHADKADEVDASSCSYRCCEISDEDSFDEKDDSSEEE